MKRSLHKKQTLFLYNSNKKIKSNIHMLTMDLQFAIVNSTSK